MKEIKDDMDHILVYLNEARPYHMGPPKTHRSWWRGLTECSSLEKGKATHSSNHTHFVSLGNFISRYLILFIAMVNGIDSLISLSGFSVSI